MPLSYIKQCKKRIKYLKIYYDYNHYTRLFLCILFNLILDSSVIVLGIYYANILDDLTLVWLSKAWLVYTIVTISLEYIIGIFNIILKFPSPNSYYKKNNIIINHYIVPMQFIIQKCLYLNNFGKYQVLFNNSNGDNWLEFHYKLNNKDDFIVLILLFDDGTFEYLTQYKRKIGRVRKKNKSVNTELLILEIFRFLASFGWREEGVDVW